MNEEKAEAKTLGQMICEAALDAKRRYRDYVDYGDVEQELWLYALGAGKPHIDRWTARGETYRIRLALAGVAKAYCENEKAEKSGYRIEDVAWYTPLQLADLIPLALDPEFDGLVTGDEDDGGPKRQTDAAEGGTLLAMIADVRKALGSYLDWASAEDFDPEDEDGMNRLVAIADRLGGEFPDSPSYRHGRRRAMSNAAAATEIRRGAGDLVGSEH